MGIRTELVKASDTNPWAKRIKLAYWRIKNLPDQWRVERGIRQRRQGKKDIKYSRVRQFQGIHKGQRCFIIATGPSLTIEDIELLKNEITFGMNSITRIFDKTDWRPTYYGIQDRQVYEKMEGSILEYYRDADNVLVADQIGRYFNVPDNFIQFPYNGNYHIYAGRYEDYSARFSDNAYEVVYDGYSITYSLIEIAVYMGFKEIYLLGCDCNYPKGAKNHFVESGFVDKNAVSNPIRMRIGYKVAKEYADRNHIKIVNCTRGGMLETYPRLELETVLSRRSGASNTKDEVDEHKKQSQLD